MKSNLNEAQIISDINALFNSKTEIQLIERDALMLQANYLSEIERLTKEKGINRKDIAFKINTSPSYLTQVFRGDKPLNFITLAKIKRALNLKFDVKASFNSEQKTSYQFDPKDFRLQTPDFVDNKPQMKLVYKNIPPVLSLTA